MSANDKNDVQNMVNSILSGAFWGLVAAFIVSMLLVLVLFISNIF